MLLMLCCLCLENEPSRCVFENILESNSCLESFFFLFNWELVVADEIE